MVRPQVSHRQCGSVGSLRRESVFSDADPACGALPTREDAGGGRVRRRSRAVVGELRRSMRKEDQPGEEDNAHGERGTWRVMRGRISGVHVPGNESVYR